MYSIYVYHICYMHRMYIMKINGPQAIYINCSGPLVFIGYPFNGYHVLQIMKHTAGGIQNTSEGYQCELGVTSVQIWFTSEAFYSWAQHPQILKSMDTKHMDKECPLHTIRLFFYYHSCTCLPCDLWLHTICGAVNQKDTISFNLPQFIFVPTSTALRLATPSFTTGGLD